MMKRTISGLLMASMIMGSSLCWAQVPPVSSAPAPVIAPLQKSQPAPFTGVLLSPEAAASIISQKDTWSAQLDLAVNHQSQLDGAQLKYQVDSLTTTFTADKRILQAQVDDGKRQVGILNDQIKQQSSGLSAPVWFGIGGAAGIVLTVLTVFAVSRATK